MEKKKFDEIVKDLTKLAQALMEKGNELMQDEKIADVNSYAVKDLIGNTINILNAIEGIKYLKEDNGANVITDDYTSKK